MVKKTKKTNVVIETTEQIVANAINSLSGDIATLSSQKESALSSFRSTANQLANINETLSSKVATMEQVISIATEEKDKANQMISDNEATRKKILEIIGG